MYRRKLAERQSPGRIAAAAALLLVFLAAFSWGSQAAPNQASTPTPSFRVYLPFALRNQLPLPTPTASVTSAFTPTRTSTASPTNSYTASPAWTPTSSATATGTRTPTASATATATATRTATLTLTATATPSGTATPTRSATPSTTATPTATASSSPTHTSTSSSTPTPTHTSVPSSTSTRTPTNTASTTATNSQTATRTATPTPTYTGTATLTNTATVSPTASHTTTHTRTATATLTSTPSWTATATPTETLAPTLGIYGWITNRGEPAVGVTVTLGLYKDGQYQWMLGETQTDADGIYTFYDIPSPGLGESYGVRYENSSQQAGRLVFWYCDVFNDYALGDSYPGGDFDIADVALLAPNSTAPQPWPLTFRWTPRAFEWAPDDVYQLVIGSEYYSDYLIGESSLTLQTLPDVLDAGSVYEWTVWVLGATGQGRALSKYSVVFSP